MRVFSFAPPVAVVPVIMGASGVDFTASRVTWARVTFPRVTTATEPVSDLTIWRTIRSGTS